MKVLSIQKCSIDVVSVRRAGFDSGDSRPILLDNVACDGSEENISQCAYDSVTNCDHSEDAGVICGGTHIFDYMYSVLVHIKDLELQTHFFMSLCSMEVYMYELTSIYTYMQYSRMQNMPCTKECHFELAVYPDLTFFCALYHRR